ncbi:MAG TPA: ABC transporter substrate-binding protein [Acetobacteraceae bacterium]|jgi:peptide/nickel transport system substrate-binding protein|nr:ABC transporter substrate-binding protein [Acetobacteraceae bacterium]
MTLKRRDVLRGAAGTLAAAPLAAPRLARAASQSTLTFVPQADLAILDPIWTTATVTRNHGFLVFDTLFGQDETFKPSPQMAAGATAEADGKTWTIKLRRGLLFHDKTPVLGRDCVASLQRWGKRDAFGQALMAATDEISAPDDTSIRFRLKKPFPLLPAALSKFTTVIPVIMPERLAKTDAFTQVTEMVGSGPYRFMASERNVGNQVVYEKFAAYQPVESGTPSWTAGPKIANFERVVWKIIPDSATASAALQNGEIDWWETPPNDYLALLRKNPNVEVKLIDPTGSVAILRMNQLVPPFDNPAIRRVVVEAVSQADYMTAVAGTDRSMWRTGVGVFTPDTPLASSDGLSVFNDKPDYDKVKRDLAAAGYNGEKIVQLTVSDLPVLTAECAVGADMFRKMGMNLDEQVMDWGSVVARRAKKDPPDKGGWNVFFTGWSGTDMFNPAGHLSLRGNGASAWFGWPTAPKIEELRSAWFDAPDLAAQKQICAEIQTQVLIDVPYVPLGQYFTLQAYRKSLAGVLTGLSMFWNVKRV